VNLSTHSAAGQQFALTTYWPFVIAPEFLVFTNGMPRQKDA
jgi:hypothetical protein